ncbi:hypothetical protein [Arthrobacter sp. StoSoilB5]|uniref:hypothetical protein n=1 Tax=Arthrobacter sp. StoSoilB5 TaxID=2830992 RepID=UPI001CC7967F|nr:hypothetical protein [Arthrobacter sp. StoSoilB5]
MRTRSAGTSRRRLRQWMLGLTVLMIPGSLVLLLAWPPAAPAIKVAPATGSAASAPAPAPSASATIPTTPTKKTPQVSPKAVPVAPKPTDFRAVASGAAEAIYTWDTRTSSYSEVYGRVRDLWVLLPDGSNPWAVLVQEFEATGVNAGSFATLSGEGAFREAKSESMMCDGQLIKVRERPAPWQGLHVCTVRLRVDDHTLASTNSYSVPVSVMVNCPPAPTAPADRCVMVAFYASSDRIVY